MMASEWVAVSIFASFGGALLVTRLNDPTRARAWTLVSHGIALLSAIIGWLLFSNNGPDSRAVERYGGWLSLDSLSAPLGPLAALVFLITTLVTLKTKIRRFSFTGSLVSEGITLATLACREPWGIIAGLALGVLPPLLELRSRGQRSRIFTLAMGTCVGLLVVGQLLEDYEGAERFDQWWASLPLLVAVMIRCGAFPFHLWVSDLFDKASFGTALLFMTPMLGAYACVRLVMPVEPDWVLRIIEQVSTFTALYTAGLALVQNEGRRFFCCLLLSHSALVFVGIETVTAIGLTGALCIWLSVGLSLTGFGLTLRAIESRRGRVSLDQYQGLYEHAPGLAIGFVLTGLSSVGFPGTVGFVGTELLVDGVVDDQPITGIAVVVACTLNGIAILRTYFKVFTGTRHLTSISLRIRPREQLALLLVAVLTLLGGVLPQPGVRSRFRAAEELLSQREPRLASRPLSSPSTVVPDLSSE
ncbi:MAG: proton-conducting transporter membrane subunit [Planctomycetaceae bacterium]